MSGPAAVRAAGGRRPGWRGPALLLARLAWLALVGVTLALFAAGLPAAVRQLSLPCAGADPNACLSFRLYPQDVRVLEQAGFSLPAYLAFGVALTVYTLAPIYAAAAMLFWRRSGTWMAMFISFALILLGPTVFNNITGPLAIEQPAWAGLIGGLQALGSWTSLVVYYLFPNGRLVPRWSWLAALAIAVFAGLHGFPAPLLALGLTPAAISALTGAGFIVFFAAGLAAQVYRYRAVSGPVERQQTKWIVLAFSLFALDEMLFYGLHLYPPAGQPGLPHLLITLGGGTANLLLLSIQPVVIALAIFRYRLWDVDLLIRRTLVYGLLSVLLGVMYFGSVLALEALFRGLFGASSNPAIIVSVLAIAALAAPLRRAVQGFIDRRFYRSQYDAARVLAAFGAALRAGEGADLQRLRDDLLAVVDDTLQPEQASLWLRPPK